VPDMISELLGWISSPWYRAVDHISSVMLSCCWLGSTKRSVLEGLNTTDIPIPGDSCVLEKMTITIGQAMFDTDISGYHFKKTTAALKLRSSSYSLVLL
jgi:hypothetical protein